MAKPDSGEEPILNPSVPVHVWLPREAVDWLDAYARALKTTRSRLIRNYVTRAWAEAQGRLVRNVDG